MALCLIRKRVTSVNDVTLTMNMKPSYRLGLKGSRYLNGAVIKIVVAWVIVGELEVAVA